MILKKIKSPWGNFYYSKENKPQDSDFKKFCHPDEIKLANSFLSEGRRQEYLTSRYLLRKNYFSPESPALLNHKDGQILWPEGWTGTLSHKKEAYVFFAKQTSESFGIDLEEVKVSEKIFNRISTEKEKSLFLNIEKPLAWSLAFSMKESLFKAFAPGAGKERFSFMQCEIDSMDFAKQSFTGFYKHMKGEGRFYLLENLIICFVKQT